MLTRLYTRRSKPPVKATVTSSATEHPREPNAVSDLNHAGAYLLGVLGLGYLLLFPALGLYALNDMINILGTDKGVAWLALAGDALVLALAGTVSYAIARFRPKLPNGQTLNRTEAPELFALIDSLQARFKAPPIHRVLLTPAYRIEVLRTPRRGYPLAFENTLKIGLPMLQTQSPLHIETQLARRIGQLAGAARRPNGWLLTLRSAWQAYARSVAGSRDPWSLPLYVFFPWYAPLFDRLSAPAVRRDEFFADDQSMEVVHHEDVAQTMVLTDITQRYLKERFWPALFKDVVRHPAPPHLPFAAMEEDVTEHLSKALSQRYLNLARLGLQPPHGNDMPGLQERLENIGHSQAELPPPVRGSAARAYLGEALGGIQRNMDKAWLETHLTQWQHRHKRAQGELHRLKTLLNQVPRNLLDEAGTWEAAQLIKKYIEDREQAARLYKCLMQTQKSDARTNFFIGRVLLSLHDPVGVEALERAMRQDATQTVPACQLITRFMVSKGERKDAQAYRRRALAYQANAA